MLTITPEEAALGAVVTGVDLHAPLPAEEIARIREALQQHEVLFFPEAHLAPAEQVQLGSAFGHLQTHVVLDALPEHPEVVIFDTERKAPVAEWWHSDVTCSPKPPMGAMLQMLIAPPSGGATYWASMTAAYDALDNDFGDARRLGHRVAIDGDTPH